MIEQIYKTIDKIIASQKRARTDHNYLKMIENAEALLEYMPTLINYSVDQEAEYRKYEMGMTTIEKDGKAPTSSYCETHAKATDFYKEWQRSKQFIELLYEMVQMSKKLMTNDTKEFKAN